MGNALHAKMDFILMPKKFVLNYQLVACLQIMWMEIVWNVSLNSSWIISNASPGQEFKIVKGSMLKIHKSVINANQTTLLILRKSVQ